ncbi:MAG: anti-sigma factor [Actinomycetota bacterium]|nr:anti-sigma factor [Actinomycetota bacterium]
MSEERRQRAVEYLIGELDDTDRAAFETECRTDPELARLVEELRPVVTRLETLPDEAWESPEPPPLVMPGVAPDRVPVEARPAPTVRRGFGWLRVGAGFAAAVLILATGVLIGTQLGGEDSSGPSAPQEVLALESVPGPDTPAGASGRVSLASSSEDAVTLDVSGLKPTGPDEFYELWLLGEEGELVALGTFRVEPDGESQIEVPLPVSPGDYQYFDVSIQPDNGDPSHSGRSVLRGVTKA